MVRQLREVADHDKGRREHRASHPPLARHPAGRAANVPQDHLGADRARRSVDDLGRDRPDLAGDPPGEVEVVDREVHHDAARPALVAEPLLHRYGATSGETQLPDHAERSGVDGCLRRGIPREVAHDLAGVQPHPGLSTHSDHRGRLLVRQGERLLADDVPPRPRSSSDHLRVRRRGGADIDDVTAREQLGQITAYGRAVAGTHHCGP